MGFFEDDAMIGFIDLEVNREVGYIAFYISPSARGLGYCKAILKLLLKEINDMDLRVLVGSVEKDNTASRKCMKSLNFVEDGKDNDGLIVYKLNLEKVSI